MYVTKSEVEQYMGLAIDDTLTTFITTVTSFAKQFIENFTGREFEVAEEDEERKFDGNGRTKLVVDDIFELTSLVVDGVELTEDEDFLLYPLNETAKEWIELIQPETRLNVNSRLNSASPYIFDKGQANVVITGRFGYSETPPEAIKMAALKIIGGVIRENIGDDDLKEVKQETLGEYSVSYATVKETANRLGVEDLLQQYVKQPLRTKTGTFKIS